MSNHSRITAKSSVATNGFGYIVTDRCATSEESGADNRANRRSCLKGAFHYDEGYVYFRNIDNRVLLGGGRNLAKAETTDVFGTTNLFKTT